jgi:hypothetical protein
MAMLHLLTWVAPAYHDDPYLKPAPNQARGLVLVPGASLDVAMGEILCIDGVPSANNAFQRQCATTVCGRAYIAGRLVARDTIQVFRLVEPQVEQAYRLGLFHGAIIPRLGAIVVDSSPTSSRALIFVFVGPFATHYMVVCPDGPHQNCTVETNLSPAQIPASFDAQEITGLADAVARECVLRGLDAGEVLVLITSGLGLIASGAGLCLRCASLRREKHNRGR